MPNCPNCGKAYNPGDEVCSDCGLVFPFATDVLASGTILQSRYEIQELSHTGGMGYIYVAKDKKLYDRLCVVKQVKEPVKSDSDLKKLEEEAQRMAKLSHPNVAMILDHFVEDNHYFLVVERISGKTLSEVFEERHGQLREDEVVSWAIAMCDVISYIHKQDIIHRDISSDNVMLTEEGNIKFVDFGTLRELRYITTKGTAGMGKYGYTPPEQWQGKPVPQSDIFALGATLYYLLTGNLPLSKEYLSGQGPQKQDFSPQFPPIRTKNPGISPELEFVLQKALQLDVHKRYTKAEEFKQALRTKDYVLVAEEENLEAVSETRLEPLPSTTDKPYLSVPSRDLDFGTVAQGAQRTKRLVITNIGSGAIIGKITATKPWIQVSPSTIDFAGYVQSILVTVDTSSLPLYSRSSGKVSILTNGGDAQVEVTVRVQQKKKSRRWQIIAAVTGSVAILILVGNRTICSHPPVLNVDISPLYFTDLKPGSTSWGALLISNTGGGTLKCTMAVDKNWLRIDPIELKVAKGEEEKALVYVNTGGLPYGFRDTGHINIKGPTSDERSIPVNLTVTKVIFEDDFSNPNSGWFVGSSEGSEVKYQDGGYCMVVKKDDEGLLSYNDNEPLLNDFVIEVDAKWLSNLASFQGYYGVGLAQDGDNWYSVDIDTNAQMFEIRKAVQGRWSVLKDWTYSDYISKNRTTNRLKVIFQRSKITVYINGVEISTVTDYSLSEGYGSLLVGKYKDKYFDAGALFDNLKIYVPD
jgi:serine/threonine protein kinase